MTPGEIQLILFRLAEQDKDLEEIKTALSGFSAWKSRMQGAIAVMAVAMVPILGLVVDHHIVH